MPPIIVLSLLLADRGREKTAGSLDASRALADEGILSDTGWVDTVSILGLVAVVGCVAAAPRRSPTSGDQSALLTRWTAAVVASGLIAQLRWPRLLIAFRRDAGAIRAGQVYRLLTSLFVQDAWLLGGVFNLAMLMIVGGVAERAFSRPRWVLIYLTGGMLSELVAMKWQPIGAGNSIAYLSLAGAVLALGLRTASSTAQRSITVAGFLLAVALCARWDIHGAAVLIGAALSLVSKTCDFRMLQHGKHSRL